MVTKRATAVRAAPDAQRRHKVLVLCSRNRWRSPTAERVFAHSRRIAVRARGLSESAVRRVTAQDIAWADLVVVMEQDHRRQLVRCFRPALGDRPVHVLDIPDEYGFMDPELVELLTTGIGAILGPDPAA